MGCMLLDSACLTASQVDQFGPYAIDNRSDTERLPESTDTTLDECFNTQCSSFVRTPIVSAPEARCEV